MKKFLSILFVAIIALATVACGPKSKKGAWVDADKKAFKDAMIAEFKKDNTDEALATKIADCAVAKIEAEFEDMVEANKAEAKLGEIGAKCAKEFMPQPEPAPVATDSTNTGDSTAK